MHKNFNQGLLTNDSVPQVFIRPHISLLETYISINLCCN